MSWKDILKDLRPERRQRFEVTDWDSELDKKYQEMSKLMREIETELVLLSKERDSAETSEEDERISVKINETSRKLKEIRQKMGGIHSEIIIRRRGSKDSE